MNVPSLVAQLAGVVAFLGTVYTIWDSSRKRSKEKLRAELSGDQLIVQSAIDLLKPYKEQVIELKKRLKETSDELQRATAQVNLLNAELADLRMQVKGMTSEINDSGGER